ncbi:unnamed protein product [Amoebophrya sp. A120]|nr:unnamed protein product [Amoebophrya sp. A120]|eukprot:GSA120T00018520001.1
MVPGAVPPSALQTTAQSQPAGASAGMQAGPIGPTPTGEGHPTSGASAAARGGGGVQAPPVASTIGAAPGTSKTPEAMGSSGAVAEKAEPEAEQQPSSENKSADQVQVAESVKTGAYSAKLPITAPPVAEQNKGDIDGVPLDKQPVSAPASPSRRNLVPLPGKEEGLKNQVPVQASPLTSAATTLVSKASAPPPTGATAAMPPSHAKSSGPPPPAVAELPDIRMLPSVKGREEELNTALAHGSGTELGIAIKMSIEYKKKLCQKLYPSDEEWMNAAGLDQDLKRHFDLEDSRDNVDDRLRQLFHEYQQIAHPNPTGLGLMMAPPQHPQQPGPRVQAFVGSGALVSANPNLPSQDVSLVPAGPGFSGNSPFASPPAGSNPGYEGSYHQDHTPGAGSWRDHHDGQNYSRDENYNQPERWDEHETDMREEESEQNDEAYDHTNVQHVNTVEKKKLDKNRVPLDAAHEAWEKKCFSRDPVPFLEQVEYDYPETVFGKEPEHKRDYPGCQAILYKPPRTERIENFAEGLLSFLEKNIKWEKRNYNHMVAWYTEENMQIPYSYDSTKTNIPKVFPDWMEAMRRHMMITLHLPMDNPPNGCNINLYRNGSAKLGAHSDNEFIFDGINSAIKIVSFSIGQPRTFQIVDHRTKDVIEEIVLPELSYFTMEGNFQRDLKHQLPEEPDKTRPRINITWRWILKKNETDQSVYEKRNNLNHKGKRSKGEGRGNNWSNWQNPGVSIGGATPAAGASSSQQQNNKGGGSNWHSFGAASGAGASQNQAWGYENNSGSQNNSTWDHYENVGGTTSQNNSAWGSYNENVGGTSQNSARGFESAQSSPQQAVGTGAASSRQFNQHDSYNNNQNRSGGKGRGRQSNQHHHGATTNNYRSQRNTSASDGDRAIEFEGRHRHEQPSKTTGTHGGKWMRRESNRQGRRGNFQGKELQQENKRPLARKFEVEVSSNPARSSSSEDEEEDNEQSSSARALPDFSKMGANAAITALNKEIAKKVAESSEDVKNEQTVSVAEVGKTAPACSSNLDPKSTAHFLEHMKTKVEEDKNPLSGSASSTAGAPQVTKAAAAHAGPVFTSQIHRATGNPGTGNNAQTEQQSKASSKGAITRTPLTSPQLQHTTAALMPPPPPPGASSNPNSATNATRGARSASSSMQVGALMRGQQPLQDASGTAPATGPTKGGTNNTADQHAAYTTHAQATTATASAGASILSSNLVNPTSAQVHADTPATPVTFEHMAHLAPPQGGAGATSSQQQQQHQHHGGNKAGNSGKPGGSQNYSTNRTANSYQQGSQSNNSSYYNNSNSQNRLNAQAHYHGSSRGGGAAGGKNQGGDGRPAPYGNANFSRGGASKGSAGTGNKGHQVWNKGSGRGGGGTKNYNWDYNQNQSYY